MIRSVVFYRHYISKRPKAFTLPELLLAMAILAFALSAIILGFITCFALNEINRNLTRATSHAQYKMEEIKDKSLSDIANETNMSKNDIEAMGLEPLPNETINITVSGVAGTSGTLLDVNLTVNWYDRGLRARNVSLQTYIAEH